MTLRYAHFPGCLAPTRLPQIEASSRAVFSRLDVELVDDLEFTCCPSGPDIRPVSTEAWIALGARNLCIAEEAELEIATPCSGCLSTLLEVKHILDNDKEIRENTNEILKVTGHEYKGKAKVKHFLQVLYEDVGKEAISSAISEPQRKKVATHYGCHLLKPSDVIGFDDPVVPVSMDEVVKWVGGQPVDYVDKGLCCGFTLSSTADDVSLAILEHKLSCMKKAGAELIVVPCPSCFLQFDLGQVRLSRKIKRSFDLPVLYFTQLLAMAMNVEEKATGLQLHKIKSKA